MRIHADLRRPAVVYTSDLDWTPSPTPGIERRMIERDGDEVARATSLVRYAPASRFPGHTHGGGEEFLVLEGVFTDEQGNHPAGTYVRNPVGSRHTPRTEPGCLILVKLWWMHREDGASVRCDTQNPRLWRTGPARGIRTLPLHRFGREETLLVDLEPGAELPARLLPGGEEIFIIAGHCADADGRYPQWTWLRRPVNAHASRLTSQGGARLYVKRGHLATPPPLPGQAIERSAG